MCVSELIFHQSTKRTVKKRQKILTLSSFLIFDYSEICRKCYCCWQYVCEKSFCFQNYPLIIRPHHAQQKAHKLTMNFHSSKKVMRLWASKQKRVWSLINAKNSIATLLAGHSFCSLEFGSGRLENEKKLQVVVS